MESIGTLTDSGRKPDNFGSDRQVFVVVAAYNEEQSVGTVVAQLLERCPNVVIVDDGSTDATLATAEGSSAYVLHHIINRGQGAALQTGIRFALLKGADVVVTFDADGQHDVRDIPSLIEPILSGESDVALGSRFLGRAHNIPFTRKWLLRAGVLFTRVVSGIVVTDVHNGLRAFSRGAARALRIKMDRMAHASEILDQIRAMGLRFKEIPANIYYSSYSLNKGQSSWNALKIALQILIERVTR